MSSSSSTIKTDFSGCADLSGFDAITGLLGQDHAERRARAGFALELHSTTVCACDFAHNEKTDAERAAVPIRTGTLEALEDPFVIDLGDADPAIGDFEH